MKPSPKMRVARSHCAVLIGHYHHPRACIHSRETQASDTTTSLIPSTVWLVHGKQFDQVAYPNRSHGIYEGAGTTLHLRHTMLRWWHNNLAAGPVDAEPEKRRANDPASRIKRGSRGG